mgnify:CR=1 FL=1
MDSPTGRVLRLKEKQLSKFFNSKSPELATLPGRCAPDDMIEILRPFDAIFLGAVGWPAARPDHETLEPLIRMRQAFQQVSRATALPPAAALRGRV